MAPGLLPSPGKTTGKGTGFVLRSNSMMSFSQLGECLSRQGAHHMLVKSLRYEAGSAVHQPRPLHVHPVLPLSVPTLVSFVVWMDSIEDISRSYRLWQGLSHAFPGGYLGCIPEPASTVASCGTPSGELRVSRCSQETPWMPGLSQNLCFLSVKKSLRNLSGWKEGRDVGTWAPQQRWEDPGSEALSWGLG